VTAHELAPADHIERCPRCGVRYVDMPKGDSLVEDLDDDVASEIPDLCTPKEG
jgi:hypothetical protein